MTNKVLGGGALDGNLGLNPTFADFDIPLGRVVQSIDENGTVFYWLVESTSKGGWLLANGLYANPAKVVGDSLPIIAGSFVDGFTLTKPNQVGIDSNGDEWKYIGDDSLPVVVAPNTDPSASGDFKKLGKPSDDDYLDLKIFQSPTDGGLTEIQTKTANGGDVYEVRKTSDDSLATIYGDADGTIEIVQNGTSNVSNSDGVVEFYIADGDYYVEVVSLSSAFNVGHTSNRSLPYVFDSVGDMVNSAIDFPINKALITKGYYIGLGGGADYLVKTAAQAATDGDIIDGYGNHALQNGNVAILQGDKLQLSQFGAVDDFPVTGTDNTLSIQAAFNNARHLIINGGIFYCGGNLTIPGTLKVLEFNAKFTTDVVTPQDSDLHPFIELNSFTGQINGVIDVEFLTPSTSITNDGVLFNACSNFKCSAVAAKGFRFGTVISGSQNFQLDSVRGDGMRGWQGGDNNGGSVLVLVSNTSGYIKDVSGTDVTKAACYFSIDGSGVDNIDITIDKVTMALADGNASAVAIRSAREVSIGRIYSTGGISSLLISREESNYVIDNVNIGRVYCYDNTFNTSISNSVYVYGQPNKRVGKVTIDYIYSRNSNKEALYVENVEYLKVGTLVSETPTLRALLIAGDVQRLDIEHTECTGAGSFEIRSIGNNENVNFGTIDVGDRGVADTTIPITFSDNTVNNLTICSIKDNTPSPAYGFLVNLGSTLASDKYFNIQSIVTKANYGLLVREGNFNVKNNKLYSVGIPADSTWEVGHEIYKENPTSGSSISWIRSSAGFIETAPIP